MLKLAVKTRIGSFNLLEVSTLLRQCIGVFACAPLLKNNDCRAEIVDNCMRIGGALGQVRKLAQFAQSIAP